MLILGLADGHDAGAALVIDDHVVAIESEARRQGVPRARGAPWRAMRAVLQEAGVRPEDVDLVGVAGRFTPPLFVRKHPGLRLLARDAFSPAVDLHVFAQAMLRQSGMGALDAERAADWFDGQLREQGVKPQRTLMVDIHAALAAAAYRCQPNDDSLLITLHPMGDGVSFAVHHARAGQVDRLWEQKGFASLHVHLQRCVEAVGLKSIVEERAFYALAARGQPDEALIAKLHRAVHPVGPRLSRAAYPLPSSRNAGLYEALGRAVPEVAAASVASNLRATLIAVVRHHVQQHASGSVALAGALLDDPRLVAELAELREVSELWVAAEPGYASLPLGAALRLAGMAPASLTVPGLGEGLSDEAAKGALSAAGLKPKPVRDAEVAAVEALIAGEGLARFVGRAGFGRYGLGGRAVLVRADRPEAVEAVRSALALSQDDEPGLIWDGQPEDGEVFARAKLAGPLRLGSAAPRVDARFAERYPGGITVDGRAHLQIVDAEQDPALAALIAGLRAETGCGAVVAFPLAVGAAVVPCFARDAVGAWRRAELPALLLGRYFVRQPKAQVKRA